MDAGIFLQVVDEKVQYLRPTNGCIYHKKKRWVYAAPIPSESGVVAAEAAAAAAAAAEAVAHAASLTRATSYVPTPVNHVRTRYEQSPGDEAAATEGAATASLSTVGHGYAYGDDHRQGFSVALRQQEDGVDYHRRHPFLEQQQQQRHQRQQEQHRTQVKAPPPLVGSGAVGRRRHRPTSSPLTPSVPEGGPLAQHSLHSGLSGLSQSDADPGERGGPAWDHGADRTGTQLLAAAMGGHGTAAAASVDEAGNRSGGGSGSGSGSGGSGAASWQEAVDQDWKTFYKRSLSGVHVLNLIEEMLWYRSTVSSISKMYFYPFEFPLLLHFQWHSNFVFFFNIQRNARFSAEHTKSPLPHFTSYARRQFLRRPLPAHLRA